MTLCHDSGVAATVLVVDDHPSFRRFARRLLEAAGFTVVDEAGDGASALAAVRTLQARRRPARRAAAGHDRDGAGGGARLGAGGAARRADLEPERGRSRAVPGALQRARFHRQARPHGRRRSPRSSEVLRERRATPRLGGRRRPLRGDVRQRRPRHLAAAGEGRRLLRGGVRRDQHRRGRVAAPAGQPHRHPADGVAVRLAARRDEDRLRRLGARRDDRLRDELAGRADLRAPRPLVSERAAPLQARPGGRRARVRARGRVRARDRALLRPAAAVRRDDHLVRAPRGADHASPRLGRRRACPTRSTGRCCPWPCSSSRCSPASSSGRRRAGGASSSLWRSRRDSWRSSSSSSSRSSVGR